MDEKMKCEVVQDLLPLYVDGACTDGSKALVEEHVKTCPGCKKLLEDMTTPLPEVPLREPTESEEVLRYALKKMRLNSKRLVALCLAILLAIPVCVVGGRELTGDGLCLSNYEEYSRVKNTVDTWVEEGSAAAANTISPRWLYENLREIKPDYEVFCTYNKTSAHGSDWSKGSYASVELMGYTFYFPGEIPWEGEYLTTHSEVEQKECYDAGDELGVVHSLMMEHKILVPEELYLAVIDAYGNVENNAWDTLEFEGEIYYYYRYYDHYNIFLDEFEPELYARVPEVEELTREYRIFRGHKGLPEGPQRYFEATYEKIYGYYQTYNAYYENMGYDTFKENWRSELKDLLGQLEELGYPVTDAKFSSIHLRRDVEQNVYYCVTWNMQMGDKRLHIEFDVRDYGTDVVDAICFPMNLYCFNAPEEVQDILDQINDLCSMSYGDSQTTLHPNFW